MATAWDELNKEIAGALGLLPESLPRRNTPEWFALISTLQSSHPDLARRVQDAITSEVAPEPLPTVSEIQAERRRASVWRSLLQWAVKPHPMIPGKTKTNRGAVLLLVVIGASAMWTLFSLSSHRNPAAPHRPSQAGQAAPAPRGGRPVQGAVGQPPAAQQPPGQPGQAGQGAQQQGQGAGQGQPQQEQGPSLAPPLPSPSPPLPPAGPASPPQAVVTPSGGGASAQVTGGGEKGPSGAQIVAAAPQEARVTIVSQGGAQQAAQGGAQGQQGQEGGGGGQAQPGGEAQGGLQIVTTQPPSGGQQGTQPQQGQGGAGSGTQAAPPSFKVGDQFTVRMLTPLAVSQAWQAIPAIAQAVDGPIAGWKVIGNASMGQDGSVQISWTQAISPDGKTTVQLHGVAYDPREGKPGVPNAQTQIMAPQAARTVLSSTLQAVNQYVQAELQSQQTVVAGLTATISSQVPPFWQILAQQLASGFQPPQAQSAGTIVVARVPQGATVTVFITQ